MNYITLIVLCIVMVTCMNSIVQLLQTTYIGDAADFSGRA